MKTLNSLLSCLFLLCSANFASAYLAEEELITRKEVEHIGALAEYGNKGGRGVFAIDADEVIFTSCVETSTGKVKVVCLYEALEELIRDIRKNGHFVVILTFNHEEAIRDKLKEIGIRKDVFPDIAAWGMKGKLRTNNLIRAKNILFRHVVSENGPFDFAVFIDNFPLFIKGVEKASSKLGLRLYSLLCTGYLPLYYPYVFHNLQKLQDGLEAKDEEAALKLQRIKRGLEKYGINIRTFRTTYPDLETFKADLPDLIWPYLSHI